MDLNRNANIFIRPTTCDREIHLDIVKLFGFYSGFKVSLGKPNVFLIDAQTDLVLSSICLLKPTDEVRYFGVGIQLHLSKYIANNLNPIITTFKCKISV